LVTAHDRHRLGVNELLILGQFMMAAKACECWRVSCGYDSGAGLAVTGMTGVWTPLTSFVGRADATAELIRLVDSYQLVTVTGPGGIGKTRLATEVARRVADRFPDGVWFIELSAVADPASVPTEMMSALGVPQEAGRPPLEVLAETLARRRLLLVLDNCEHVLPAVAAACGALLGQTSGVRVLATSREQLGVSGEAQYRLAPLELPAGPGAVARSPAAALFIERARQADSRFAFSPDSPEQAALVTRVVTKLDGMPLAIELAAARVEALGLAGLADRIDEALRLLTDRGPLVADRHRSLAAVADWSYRLLTGPEQRVFRQLAVFPGAFTLEAAEAVAGPGGGYALLRLVDCSLVVPPRQDADGRSRYTMLETLRAYGLERLREAGEEPGAAAALAGFAWSVAGQAAAGMAASDAKELEALRWLDAEDATLSRGLSWALDSDPGLALGLATALVPWLRMRGRVTEAGKRLRTALARSAPAGQGWAKAQLWLGYLSSSSADPTDAIDCYTAVIEAHRDQAPSYDLILALCGRTMGRLAAGDDPASVHDARRALELSREHGVTSGELLALTALSLTAWHAGDAASVLDLARQAEALLPTHTSPYVKRCCFLHLAVVLRDTGALDAARRVCAGGLALSRPADDATRLISLLTIMASIERLTGNVSEATVHLGEAAGIACRNGDHINAVDLVDECAYLCAETGRWDSAVTLWAALDADRGHHTVPAWQPNERGRAWYLRRINEVREAGQLRAARERGAGMTVPAAAEFALTITTSVPAVTLEPAPGTLLSPRERELVILVAQGHTNAQIASRLQISVRTVTSHLDRIRDKTGHRRRADLTRLALEESLV
jgi:predicted ATPase/DNA-binding CsgD family transcriptional regulator